MKREKLARVESRKLEALRLRKGIYGIDRHDSEADGICREAESRRQAIVADPAFWAPIDTINLDTSQADRILKLRQWQADKLGTLILKQVRSRILKIKAGGHANGSKAKARGPKAKGIGKPEVRPGKPSEHGKRRYKPKKERIGSAFDKIDLDEATSAACLWLFDNLDGRQASIFTAVQGSAAWLPTLSPSMQRERLAACRQAYFVQDNGIDPVPSLHDTLDAIPQADRSKAWGHDTLQHTCKACGHKHYGIGKPPMACEKCEAVDFRSEAIGPISGFLKACAYAVGKALVRGRLRFPGKSKQGSRSDVDASMASLEAVQEAADGKPNKWEAVQESRYRNIDGKALCRLAVQEAKCDPKGDRLTAIIVAKLRGYNDTQAVGFVRKALADRQADKIGADRRRLAELGINPPSYSRRTFYNDVAEVRSIGKLCSRRLEAEAVQESQAWLAVQEADPQAKPPIRLWYKSMYRTFRRLRKLGQAADLKSFLDGKPPTASLETKQVQAVQESLRYCRYWASHAWDRRLLTSEASPYVFVQEADPQDYLDAKAVAWDQSAAWLRLQAADRRQPVQVGTKADPKAEAAKRQALRYCDYWASHAWDRREADDKPENYLAVGFNNVAWDQSAAWLRIVPTKAG